MELPQKVRLTGNSQELPVTFGSKPWALQVVRALRPHQWLKNLLIALPAIAAHDLSFATAKTLFLAFLSYSLFASAAYVINDLLDREHDRKHPRKKGRPFASGALTVVFGGVLAACLLVLGVVVSLPLPSIFLVVLGGYVALSLAYSVYLKQLLMVDVVLLACFYGLRVIAGSVAASVPLSEWLIVFCVFFFVSLALVKRTAELKTVPSDIGNRLTGRGYRTDDFQTMQSLSGAAGFVSVLVLALYLNSEDVRALYSQPLVLWGVGLILIFWIGRVILMTGRGEMHDDPVIFAVTDGISLLCAGGVAALLALAV